MLREFAADLMTSLGVACVARGERLRKLAGRWNARARWLADVADWLSTHKTWAEIRSDRGQG